MQPPARGIPAPGVIFDCDLGNAVDDVLALALLYGLDNRGDIRLVSVSISNPNLHAAAFAEAVGRFYAGAVSGAFGGRGRSLPVGLATHAPMTPDTPLLMAPLAKKTAEGKPVYEHDIERITDTAEPRAVIRNALTAQHPQNAIVVLAGPATNLAALLQLPGAKELIREKVKFLAVMAGSYPEGEPDPQIKADIAAARKLFAEWPTPVVAAGLELSQQVRYPATAIESAFAWAPHHPVVDAYKAHRPFPYDAETGALAAALYAVKPEDGFFRLSEPGRIVVLDDGRTRFTPAGSGNHRHLVFDPAQQERLLRTYVEITSAKPQPRQSRFRRAEQKQEQKQTPPPKP
jgi:inosine-uridine nucleoside N-ribohydrolase